MRDEANGDNIKDTIDTFEGIDIHKDIKECLVNMYNISLDLRLLRKKILGKLKTHKYLASVFKEMKYDFEIDYETVVEFISCNKVNLELDVLYKLNNLVFIIVKNTIEEARKIDVMTKDCSYGFFITDLFLDFQEYENINIESEVDKILSKIMKDNKKYQDEEEKRLDKVFESMKNLDLKM